MADEFDIRSAKDADVPAITEIYAHHVLHGTGTFELTPPNETEIASRLAAVRERGLPWYVVDDGEVLGYAYVGPFRARPAYDWIVEDSIYVRADRLGRGIGSALLGALIDRSTELGYRQMVSLIGDSTNEGSIRLHHRWGFTHAGTLAAVGWKDERWLDVVMMQRALGPGSDTAAGRRPASDGV